MGEFSDALSHVQLSFKFIVFPEIKLDVCFMNHVVYSYWHDSYSVFGVHYGVNDVF
jgi:hypothetical protein